MSLKARLNRIAEAIQPATGIRCVWVRYGAGATEIRRYPPNSPAVHLFLGPEIPNELFEPGTALLGVERGKPYPIEPAENPWPDDPMEAWDDEPWPVLTAERVDEVLDAIQATLPPRLAAIFRGARQFVIMGPGPLTVHVERD